jgi:glycerophosphoryl diester phosphodiesterase
MDIIAHRIVNEKINNKKLLSKLLFSLKNKNIQGVEFDIRQTKDGKLIASHDPRFPQAEKKIKNYTFEKLKEEAFKGKFSFLTMEEVIEEIPKNFIINIDIKDPKTDIKNFLRIIKNYNISERVIVSSFYPKIIFKLRFSNIKKRWLLTNFSLKRNLFHLIYTLFPIKTGLLCKATGIAPHFSLINKKTLKKAHNKNFTVAVWTINDEKTMLKFKKINTDYLIVKHELLI